MGMTLVDRRRRILVACLGAIVALLAISGAIVVATGLPPTTVDDAYQTPVGQDLHVPEPGVLTNDTDNSSGMAADIQTGATTTAGGTVYLNADGSFDYTVPSPTFQGLDTFTYTATNDVGTSDPATVTITVDSTPAAVADSHSTNEDIPLSVGAPGVLATTRTLTPTPR